MPLKMVAMVGCWVIPDGGAAVHAPRRGSVNRASAELCAVEGARPTERLIEHDRHGVREVQRANRAERGDAERRLRVLLDEIGGQARALAAEDEGVPGAEIAVEVAPRREGAEQTDARVGVAVLKMPEVEV